MHHPSRRFVPYRFLKLLSTALAALVAACTSGSNGPQEPPIPLPMPAPLPASQVIGPIPAAAGSARSSSAVTPKAYRQDGASHLYGLNASRIYKGRLPPQLYAVGVLNLELDGGGRIARLVWLRAPRHAPEVVAEIERTVRAAAPFPAPTRLGKVVYTDTWLWHKSGQFQLDTLTEGQD